MLLVLLLLLLPNCSGLSVASCTADTTIVNAATLLSCPLSVYYGLLVETAAPIPTSMMVVPLLLLLPLMLFTLLLPLLLLVLFLMLLPPMMLLLILLPLCLPLLLAVL